MIIERRWHMFQWNKGKLVAVSVSSGQSSDIGQKVVVVAAKNSKSGTN